MFQTIKDRPYAMIKLIVPMLMLVSLIAPVNICIGKEEQLTSPVIYVCEDPHASRADILANSQLQQDLLLLRDSLKSMGISVKWNAGPITPNKSVTTFSLQIGSKEVGFNLGRRDCQVFFLEQAPIIINGQTMVPYGLLREIAGKTANRDINLQTLANSESKNMVDRSADGGYKYYDLQVGDPCGPPFDQAQAFVLEKGYLTYVQHMEYTPIRNDTMVVGDDKGREKRIWLEQNSYTGEISVTGTAYSNEGIKRETVIKKLQSQGIPEQRIKTIAIFPTKTGKLCWYVEVPNGKKTNRYFYDFYTGDRVADEYNAGG